MTKFGEIQDSGERILPTREGEISIIYSRQKFAYEYISQFVKNKSVIDLGCGTGYGSKLLSETAGEVSGIDYDGEAISYCRNNYEASNLTFIQSDILNYRPEKQFDIAISLQVIEHFDNVSVFLNKIKSCVKFNGRIFISTPNVSPARKNMHENKYHLSDMDYAEFRSQLNKHFSKYEILGIAYAKDNILRKLIGFSLNYKLGKKIRRSSKIKNIACNTFDLTKFKIIDSDVQKKAADLLAVCENV